MTTNKKPYEKIVRSVSKVICLQDDFTGGPVIGNITKLAFREGNAKFIKNLRGYYIAAGLDTGSYTLDVAAEYYFNKAEIQVDIDLNHPQPVESLIIRLTPNCRYPFPSGATLVRGRVRDTNGKLAMNKPVELYAIPVKPDLPGISIGATKLENNKITLELSNTSTTIVIKRDDYVQIQNGIFLVMEASSKEDNKQTIKVENAENTVFKIGDTVNLYAIGKTTTLTDENGEFAAWIKRYEVDGNERKISFILLIDGKQVNVGSGPNMNKVQEGSAVFRELQV